MQAIVKNGKLTHGINKYKYLLPFLQVIYEKITGKPPKPCNKTFNLCKEKLTELY